jgi:hypothetical protein
MFHCGGLVYQCFTSSHGFSLVFHCGGLVSQCFTSSHGFYLVFDSLRSKFLARVACNQAISFTDRTLPQYLGIFLFKNFLSKFETKFHILIFLRFNFFVLNIKFLL